MKTNFEESSVNTHHVCQSGEQAHCTWTAARWAAKGAFKDGVQKPGFDRAASNSPNLGTNCMKLTNVEQDEASSLVFVANDAIVNIAVKFSGTCHSPAFARNTRADNQDCRHRRRRNGLVNLRRRSGVALRSLGCKV